MLYETHELTRRFHRAGVYVTALDRVSLRVSQGELVAIVGPSGCGKTTLLQALGAIDPEYEGTLKFAGQELRQLSARERAVLRLSQIGFVFQTFQLLDALTVQENIALPLWRLRGDRRGAEAKARNLAEELGIAHRLTQRPRELSVGEMQRAAVARAMVCDPAVILADEPTASVDSENGRCITAVLQSIVEGGRTVLVASHDAAVVAIAHRVLRLQFGRVVESPSPPATEAHVGLVGRVEDRRNS